MKKLTQQEVRNGLKLVEYNLNNHSTNQSFWKARRKDYLHLLLNLQLREFDQS